MDRARPTKGHRLSEPERKQVTIVGGGFSGAIFAHHLLRESPSPVIVDIVEERARLGAGVAYSGANPHQTTNIPAARMSVYPEDRTHFERWLAAHGDSDTGEPDHYPIRFLFGSYVDELVRNTQPGHPESELHHRHGRVAGLNRRNGALTVHALGGVTWPADAAVLATGNPLPKPPAPLGQLAEDPRVILDPWAPDALAAVKPDDHVLVLGVSLSMGEAVAGLRAAGHRGPVVAIARRGRRPKRGLIEAPPTFGEFFNHRPKTAVALLRHFRGEIRRAAAAGLSWRSVQAGVRAHGWAVWSSLPPVEKRRFVRHLRPFWEALRHVMPGPVHDKLVAEERAGTLKVLAASLQHLEAEPGGLYATLHRRGAARHDTWRERFDVVLNCTGPAYATVTETDPFWRALARDELVRPDPVGLGIAVDGHGRALDGAGSGQADLLVLGTLARGTFGELTGVPELSRQALEAARTLVSGWRTDQAATTTMPMLKKAV